MIVIIVLSFKMPYNEQGLCAGRALLIVQPGTEAQ